MTTVVEIDGLSKQYGDFTAVADLSLSAEVGETLALLGPNGAGKTTTIRMLMGILQSTAGTARILNRDCFRERSRVMRVVGYVPDDPIFYDYLRASEVLRFVGGMHGLSATETFDRARPMAERFDLENDLEEFAANYSKGMKKKLAVIAALLHRPRVLILDEPTSGLDPHATRILHELVREQAGDGATVFLSTHLLDQAERLCDRIGILHKGRLAALGTLSQLQQRVETGSSLEEIFFSVTGASFAESPEPDKA